MDELIGRGWAFPVQRDRVSRHVALVAGEEEIQQSIVMILGTVKGERVLRPEFGCGIHDIVFASNDITSIGLAIYAVEQALGMWEPRIRVVEVTVQPMEHSGESFFRISIHYEIKATLDQRTLVYPFYRIPGE